MVDAIMPASLHAYRTNCSMSAPALTWLLQLPGRLSGLLPCHCALCGGLSTHPLCAACDTQFFLLADRRCPQCGIAMPRQVQATVCSLCLRRPPAFDATIVVTDYTAPVDQLVLALKFGRRLALAPALAGLLQRAFEAAAGPRPDLMLAVPLGLERLADRGFNQALEMARPLAKALDLPLKKNCVLRQRETPPQSLQRPSERRKNMRHAFTVPHDARDTIKDRHVLVVDDVMTTGETLNELAATLKRCGAGRVTNLVFARALPQ